MHVLRMFCACSAHVLRMVGDMGRAALYLRVSPNGLWPAARSRPVAGLHADATQPATGHLALPVLSLPFPVSPMSRC